MPVALFRTKFSVDVNTSINQLTKSMEPAFGVDYVPSETKENKFKMVKSAAQGSIINQNVPMKWKSK